MSVWKQVKSDILARNVNERMLVQALADLGIGINKDIKTIRNSWGSSFADRGYTYIKNVDMDKMLELWTIIE